MKDLEAGTVDPENIGISVFEEYLEGISKDLARWRDPMHRNVSILTKLAQHGEKLDKKVIEGLMKKLSQNLDSMELENLITAKCAYGFTCLHYSAHFLSHDFLKTMLLEEEGKVRIEIECEFIS